MKLRSPSTHRHLLVHPFIAIHSFIHQLIINHSFSRVVCQAHAVDSLFLSAEQCAEVDAQLAKIDVLSHFAPGGDSDYTQPELRAKPQIPVDLTANNLDGSSDVDEASDVKAKKEAVASDGCDDGEDDRPDQPLLKKL